MATTSPQKRQKERNRQDRQKEKLARRQLRKEERAGRPEGSTDEDPDLAGIVAGPQPSSEPGEPPPAGPQAER